MEASVQRGNRSVHPHSGRPLRILSWNVNGLSAVLKRLYGPSGTITKFLNDIGANADIVCLQETKLRKSELAAGAHQLATAQGWDSFFSCSNSPRGYSGTATFCRTGICLPFSAEIGFTGLAEGGQSAHSDMTAGGDFPIEELRNLDSEGRVVITDHSAFVLFNIYGPAVTSEDPDQARARAAFKMRFFAALQRRWEGLLSSGRSLIVVGDLNIAPAPIDYPDHDPDFYRTSRPDRLWLRSLLGQDPQTSTKDLLGNTEDNSQSYRYLDEIRDHRILPLDGDAMNTSNSSCKSKRNIPYFMDCFRVFHPTRKKAFTVWNTSTGARANNYGSRIDLTLAAGLKIRSTTLIKDQPDSSQGGQDQEERKEQYNQYQDQDDQLSSPLLECSNFQIVDADIEPNIQGSDHCPVWVDVGLSSSDVLSSFPCATTAPPCAMRFCGKQTKLHGWLVRKKNANENEAIEEDAGRGAKDGAKDQGPKDELSGIQMSREESMDAGTVSTGPFLEPTASTSTGAIANGSARPKQAILKSFFRAGGSAGGANRRGADPAPETTSINNIRSPENSIKHQMKYVNRIEQPAPAPAPSFSAGLRQSPLEPLVETAPSTDEPASAGPVASQFIQAELDAAAEVKKRQMTEARGAWQVIQQRMQVPRCQHGFDAAKKRVNKSGPNHGENKYYLFVLPYPA